MHEDVQFSGNNYLNVYLIFTVYGHKQAHTLQTHFRHAVPLVWSLLRLTLISFWSALTVLCSACGTVVISVMPCANRDDPHVHVRQFCQEC